MERRNKKIKADCKLIVFGSTFDFLLIYSKSVICRHLLLTKCSIYMNFTSLYVRTFNEFTA